VIESRKIAKEWVRKSQQIEDAPHHVGPWDCSTKSNGDETSTTVCRRSGKRIKFLTGAFSQRHARRLPF
jgi:hypothetical protein